MIPSSRSGCRSKSGTLPNNGLPARARLATLRATNAGAYVPERRGSRPRRGQDRVNPAVFPLTAKYDPEWIRDNALGENALCQVESLARRLPLRAGMRVLDLGCGKATSSIFLAREFGIEAWAADAATSPTENRKRAIELDCDASVFPLRVDAHSLPFAKEFFDAVIAIDSFLYFGTDDRYLGYLIQFIKPGGFIG